MPHVQRNGVKVYYESHGQGTPIVFLHPFSTNGKYLVFPALHLCPGLSVHYC